MNVQLPKQLKPAQFAAKGLCFQGQLALANMPRLAELLREPRGEVVVALAFAYAGSRVIVDLQVKVDLVLTCQRCMAAMVLPVDVHTQLTPVDITQAPVEELPADLEPLALEGEAVDLLSMVEDELLLQLPSVPKHEVAQCEVEGSAIPE